MSFLLKHRVVFLLLFSFFCFLFLSVGYAYVSYDLNVSGDITLDSQNGVVITKVDKVRDVGDTYSKVVHYVGTVLTMSIEFDDSMQSSVLYKVQVENNTNDYYLFSDMIFDENNLFDTYTNANIIPVILSEEDLHNNYIEDQNSIFTGDILMPHSIRNFYVEYQYRDSEVSYDKLLEKGMVNFKFQKVHMIICDSNLYPNYVLDGESLVIHYDEHYPNRIEIYDNREGLYEDYTYESGYLVVNAVSSSLKIVEYYE